MQSMNREEVQEAFKEKNRRIAALEEEAKEKDRQLTEKDQRIADLEQQLEAAPPSPNPAPAPTATTQADRRYELTVNGEKVVPGKNRVNVEGGYIVVSPTPSSEEGYERGVTVTLTAHPDLGHKVTWQRGAHAEAPNRAISTLDRNRAVQVLMPQIVVSEPEVPPLEEEPAVPAGVAEESHVAFDEPEMPPARQTPNIR